MSNTGEHKAIADAKAEDPTIAGTMWAIARFIIGRERILAVVSVAVLVGSGFVGAVWAQDKLDGGAAHAVAPVADAVKVQTDRLDQHLADDAQFRREIARRQDEASADIRALYKTVLTGERQYRLERPLPAPDGGP